MQRFPFDVIVEQANDVIKSGGEVFQQFECSHCGTKQTMDVPNTFYRSGLCEECGKLTDIESTGCNLLVIWRSPTIPRPPSNGH